MSLMSIFCGKLKLRDSSVITNKILTQMMSEVPPGFQVVLQMLAVLEGGILPPRSPPPTLSCQMASQEHSEEKFVEYSVGVNNKNRGLKHNKKKPERCRRNYKRKQHNVDKKRECQVMLMTIKVSFPLSTIRA